MSQLEVIFGFSRILQKTDEGLGFRVKQTYDFARSGRLRTRLTFEMIGVRAG